MRAITLKALLVIFLISFIPRLILLSAAMKNNHGDLSALVLDNDGNRFYQTALLAGDPDYNETWLARNRFQRFSILWDVPLYPLFLTAFFKLFQPSYLLAIFLNLILFSLSASIFYVIGVNLFGGRGSLYATLIYAFFPTLLINSLNPMAEPMFLVFFLLALLCFILFLKNEEKRHLIFTAILLGLSAMTKEVALFFIAVPAAVIILKYIKKWRMAVKAVFILLVAYYAVLLPLAVYNYNISRHFVVSGKMVKMAVYQKSLRVLELRSKKSADPSFFLWDYFYKRKHFFFSTGTTDLMQMTGRKSSALCDATEDPGSFLAALKEAGPGWVSYQFGSLFFVACVYLFSLLGLCALFIRRKFKEALGVLLAVSYFPAVYFHHDYSRYFIPAIPFLSLLAAYFLLVIKGIKTA